MAPAAQKQWFIMYAIPTVADEMSKKFPNASFTFSKVPLLSHLTVASNVATPAGNIDYPFIAATDDCGFLLLCGYTVIGLTYYICDPLFRRTLGILPPDGGFNSRRTVGLIRNRRDKQVMVAQLNSWLFENQRRITLSCTVNMCKWVKKEFLCDHIGDINRWRCDGVLSHEGFLWWFDLSFCILACNPFEGTPALYQIMFPDVADAVPLASFPFDGDIHRCLKVSQGSLRYVQIHGNAPEKLEVSMWKLSSNNPACAIWQKMHNVSLLDIWNHPKNHLKYNSMLHPGVVPTVALIDPMKAKRVYFFLGKRIFYVNLETKRMNHCMELGNQELPVLSSLMVHSWKLPVGATEIATENHLYGPDEFNAPGVHFLTLYDSVDDFLEKAIDVMSRSCPELFNMDLEECEEDEEDEDDSEMMEGERVD